MHLLFVTVNSCKLVDCKKEFFAFEFVLNLYLRTNY